MEIYLQPDEPAPFAGALLDEDRFRQCVVDRKMQAIGCQPQSEKGHVFLALVLGIVLGAFAEKTLN